MKRLNLTKGAKKITIVFLLVIILAFALLYLSFSLRNIECPFRLCAGFGLYAGLLYMLYIWFYISRQRIMPFLGISAFLLGEFLIGNASLVCCVIIFLPVLLCWSKADAERLIYEETQEEKK